MAGRLKRAHSENRGEATGCTALACCAMGCDRNESCTPNHLHVDSVSDCLDTACTAGTGRCIAGAIGKYVNLGSPAGTRFSCTYLTEQQGAGSQKSAFISSSFMAGSDAQAGIDTEPVAGRLRPIADAKPIGAGMGLSRLLPVLSAATLGLPPRNSHSNTLHAASTMTGFS